jgi:hypothetical protein
MTTDELATLLADAQSALYALQQADNLTAPQRIEIMRIHSDIGTAVYDAMTGDIQTP